MELCCKCKVKERTSSTSYCVGCYAEYMKEYRLKKQAEMDKPVAIEPIKVSFPTIKQIVDALEVGKYLNIEIKSSDVAALKTPPENGPSPIYWSYYVTKGSELQRKFKAIEKEMELSQSLSGTP